MVHLPTGSKGGPNQGPFAFFSEPQSLSQEGINTCEYVMQCLIACNDTNILIMLSLSISLETESKALSAFPGSE